MSNIHYLPTLDGNNNRGSQVSKCYNLTFFCMLVSSTSTIVSSFGAKDFSTSSFKRRNIIGFRIAWEKTSTKERYDAGFNNSVTLLNVWVPQKVSIYLLPFAVVAFPISKPFDFFSALYIPHMIYSQLQLKLGRNPLCKNTFSLSIFNMWSFKREKFPLFSPATFQLDPLFVNCQNLCWILLDSRTWKVLRSWAAKKVRPRCFATGYQSRALDVLWIRWDKKNSHKSVRWSLVPADP